MADGYNKPIPIPQPESDNYWEGAKAGELRLRHCDDCNKAYFYPRNICPDCGNNNTSWITASGKAKIHTFAIVHRPPHPGFADFRFGVGFDLTCLDTSVFQDGLIPPVKQRMSACPYANRFRRNIPFEPLTNLGNNGLGLLTFPPEKMNNRLGSTSQGAVTSESVNPTVEVVYFTTLQ